MHVDVYCEEISDNVHTSIIKEVVDFANTNLNIHEEDFKIEIFLDDIEEGTNGMLIDDIPNKKFIMLVQNGRHISHILMTIVHELVHVKQYIRDGLAEVGENIFKTVPYLERWWEKEAFEKTSQIIENYIRHLEKNGLTTQHDLV